MSLDKKIKDYKESINVLPNEEKIKDTVTKSIDAFCSAQQQKILTYWEFLWTQLKLIQKRWWFFQLLLLIVLWIVLPSMKGEQFMPKTLGVIASLFVILIIPELWKNKTNKSMEIECTSYYSLRQIYAARMMLFGIVDIALVSLFCVLSSLVWEIVFSELLVQFILPMVVTSCICFAILCSKHSFSETIAVMTCILWSAIWLLVVLNENVYDVITFPLWIIFLVIAFAFLVFTIHRTIYYCNNYWEVPFYGIDVK